MADSMMQQYTKALIAYLDARRDYEDAREGSMPDYLRQLQARMDDYERELLPICAKIEDMLNVHA